MGKLSQSIGWVLAIIALVITGYIWLTNTVNPVTMYPPTIVGLFGIVLLLSPYLPAEEKWDGIAESARFIVAGAGGGLAAKITFDYNYQLPVVLILIFGVFIALLFFETVLRLYFHRVIGAE